MDFETHREETTKLKSEFDICVSTYPANSGRVQLTSRPTGPNT